MKAVPQFISEVRIRRMREGDLAQVREIDHHLAGKERASTWLESVDSVWFSHRPALNLVAELHGQVVGFLLGDIRGGAYGLPFSGWIDMMGVHPQFQRLGIGRRLVEEFCSRCRENGVQARLIVREEDKRLIRFFASLGFRRGKLINLER